MAWCRMVAGILLFANPIGQAVADAALGWIAEQLFPRRWSLTRWLSERKRSRRMDKGLCPACGYDLRGNVSLPVSRMWFAYGTDPGQVRTRCVLFSPLFSSAA